MKRCWILLCLAALAYGQSNGFIVGQGPGKMVDTLIAAGYRELSVYDSLVQMQNDANPAITGVLTDAFLQTLANCPAGSPIFTHTVQEYAGQGYVASDNCTVAGVGLLNAGSYNGRAGAAAILTNVEGVPERVALLSASGPAPLAVLDSSGSPNGLTCPAANPGSSCIKVFGIAYAPSGPSRSFVLSDEAPGRLLAALKTAGYGELSVHDALIQAQQESNPDILSALPNDFLARLGSCAPGGPLYATTLSSLTGTFVLSDDCSVQTGSLQGSTFTGRPGTSTLATDVSGVGPAAVVYATSSAPLASWTRDIAVGSGTATVTYNAMAIFYGRAAAPTGTPVPAPAPPAIWLALTGALALAGRQFSKLRRNS